MWVCSVGWEDPLEGKVTNHSSILAWRISWTKEADLRRVSTESTHMHVLIMKQPHQVKSNDIKLVMISMVHVQRNMQ